MAGLGFKDFQVGEVATAADVDGYLMQQSVMRFASSAARGSALGTATGTAVPLAEGMVSYLDDLTDRAAVQFYNGTAWSPISAVIQVVYAVKTDTFTTTSTSYTNITGLSGTITMSSTSSRLLAVAFVSGIMTNTTNAGSVALRLTDGTNTSDVASSVSNRTAATAALARSSQVNQIFSASMSWLYTPGVTAALTVTAQALRAGTGGTVYINREQEDSDAAQAVRPTSSLLLIEVAA